MLNNIPEDDFLLLSNYGIYIVSSTILPVRKHQAEEEILKKEKELASLIYYKRDNEGS